MWQGHRQYYSNYLTHVERKAKHNMNWRYMSRLLVLVKDFFKKYLHLQLFSTMFQFYHQVFLFLNKTF